MMKPTIFRVIFAAATLLAMVSARTTRAEVSSKPILGYFGEEIVSADGVNKNPGHTQAQALTVVYDNSSAAPNYGVISTDPTSVWGDELFTIMTGPLSTHRFTIFNSASSGILLTATVQVSFFDAGTSALLGGYLVSLDFGGGLNPGFFAQITVTGLDPLLIQLGTNHLLVTQKVVTSTGAVTALGIVSRDPVAVGASPPSMYISSSTIGGGVPGFYTFGTGPANPGYQLVVDAQVVRTNATSWGRLKSLYR